MFQNDNTLNAWSYNPLYQELFMQIDCLRMERTYLNRMYVAMDVLNDVILHHL
jgi:hypothetical protein